MIQTDFYVLTLCFLSGTTACLMLLCHFMLKRKGYKYRFQKILSVVLCCHALAFFNNYFVMLFGKSENADFINTLFLTYDFCVSSLWIVFIIDLISPKLYKLKHLLTIPGTFVLSIIIYAITRSDYIYFFDLSLTCLLVIVFYIILEIRVKRYTSTLKQNISDLQYFDLQWVCVVLRVLLVMAGVWIAESIVQKSWFSTEYNSNNLIIDILWCLIAGVVALYITKSAMNQQIYTINSESKDTNKATDNPSQEKAYYAKAIKQNIDEIILREQYYLNKDLSLNSLASLLGTNRQYLSSYIKNIKHSTFYDYVNEFRLSSVLEKLNATDNLKQVDWEEIIGSCGFNSYSTFLRVFKKRFKMLPSKYVKELQKSKSPNK